MVQFCACYVSDIFQCSYFIGVGGESHKCTLCLYESFKMSHKAKAFQHFSVIIEFEV
jgi:hypothetical protein